VTAVPEDRGVQCPWGAQFRRPSRTGPTVRAGSDGQLPQRRYYLKTPGLEVNRADQPTKNETTNITDSELPTARWWTEPGFGDLGPVKVPQLRGDTAAGFSHGFSMVQRLCTSAFKN
jgi:hypothetical protein